MAVYGNRMCISCWSNIQLIQITPKGRIGLKGEKRCISSECVFDIVADEVGDFWISDEENIRRIRWEEK